jgi:hypothetical protein
MTCLGTWALSAYPLEHDPTVSALTSKPHGGANQIAKTCQSQLVNGLCDTLRPTKEVVYPSFSKLDGWVGNPLSQFG